MAESIPTTQPCVFKNGIETVPGLEDLPDDAELWRYMRLSTLLMLLRGKVFIPTIEELRFGDPLEATHLCPATRSYFDKLPDQDCEWLLGRATDDEQFVICHLETSPDQRARTFVDIWRRELARRRRVWCWHQADIESMALWQIYAKEGVAVRTTPARIKQAFPQHAVDTGLIARVSYVEHARREADNHHFMRSYLFKQKCYRHESEVRVVLPRDSENLDERRLLPLDPDQLIAGIQITPHIPRSEAAEIRQSILHAWRKGRDIDDGDGLAGVFISPSKTVFKTAFDGFFMNDSESTGIANLGKTTPPFVECGDLCSNLEQFMGR